MITGARRGKLSGLRRLVAGAMALDLNVFLVPGADIARAHGLDIEAAGLQQAASPRHASVLLVVGDISPALREAATVVYAQMVRPRALFAVGTEELSPLPPADVTAGLSQQELLDGVHQLRKAFAEGAFQAEVSDFDAAVLQIRIEYTCPMHPEIVQDEPGSCPKCGMFLVPSEVQAGIPHLHTDSHTGRQAAPEQEQKTSHKMDHGVADEYTCPMHPDVVQNEPGQCPKCGMNLVPREVQPDAHEHEHAGHEHGGMDHSAMDNDDMGFMSMIDVTKDLPRSCDGLPMEWIDAPFGPFFPGLPGGLLLTLILDGDTVAGSDAHSLAEPRVPLAQLPMDTARFVEIMAGTDPLAPVAYRLLACRALESVTAMEQSAEAARARIGALERERIASHLNWLALFGQQTGFDWLQQHAASLQLDLRHADLKQVMALKPAIQSLIKRLQRTPLLKFRTAGIGRLMPDCELHGPVARAVGIDNDARSTDETFTTLGFTSANRTEGDAFARLHVRLDEITRSLTLIKSAGTIALPTTPDPGEVTGSGKASVETPRGQARLQLTLEQGQVTTALLATPSTHHLSLVQRLTEQQELGDALVAVGSLDLSPWEVRQ